MVTTSFLQALYSGRLHLRLARQLGRTVTKARDVVLHVGDLLLLPLVLLHLILLELGAGAHKRVVVACREAGLQVSQS